MKANTVDNTFNTKIGKFQIVLVPRYNQNLLQQGIERISGYDLKNKILYVADYLESSWKNDCVKSFIRAIEEKRLCLE